MRLSSVALHVFIRSTRPGKSRACFIIFTCNHGSRSGCYLFAAIQNWMRYTAVFLHCVYDEHVNLFAISPSNPYVPHAYRRKKYNKRAVIAKVCMKKAQQQCRHQCEYPHACTRVAHPPHATLAAMNISSTPANSVHFASPRCRTRQFPLYPPPTLNSRVSNGLTRIVQTVLLGMMIALHNELRNHVSDYLAQWVVLYMPNISPAARVFSRGRWRNQVPFFFKVCCFLSLKSQRG